MLRDPRFWVNIAIIAFIGYVYYDWYERFEWFWWFSIYEGFRNATGSLFFIPFAYGSIIFRFRGALIFWTLSFAIALPRILLMSFHIDTLATNIIIAFVPLMITGIITIELKWRKRQRRMLEQREEERQTYMAQIFRTQEKERQRISLELHDSCLQELIATANRAYDLTLYKNGENIAEIHEHALWIRDTIMHVSEEIRRISVDLRPILLDSLGLVSAVRWLVDRMNRESEINTKVSVIGRQRKLHSETEATLFRIVQEALNNVRRHSKATESVIILEFKPESIRLIIEDNGKGFDKKATLNDLVTRNQLGILSIEQRTKSINGVFTIQSRFGKGTSITIDADIN